MRRPIIAGLALSLAACVVSGSEPAGLRPLAEDGDQPVLALFEHVLTAHFAAFGAKPPTTCAVLRPGPLTAEQEQALIVRFDKLAPAGRCGEQGGGQVDAITGEPAGVVEVYDFACRDAAHCTGWVAAPGRPAIRYALRFDGGMWVLSADPRLLAE